MMRPPAGHDLHRPAGGIEVTVRLTGGDALVGGDGVGQVTETLAQTGERTSPPQAPAVPSPSALRPASLIGLSGVYTISVAERR
jgi:hypothetical protein